MKFNYISNKFNYSKAKIYRKCPIKKILTLSLMASLCLTGCDIDSSTKSIIKNLDNVVVKENVTEIDTLVKDESVISDNKNSEKNSYNPNFSIVEEQENNETTYNYEINNPNASINSEIYNDNSVNSEKLVDDNQNEVSTSNEQILEEKDIIDEKDVSEDKDIINEKDVIEEKNVINEKNVIEENKEVVEEKNIVEEKKIVAITFDDGPSKYTSELVDILKENNVNATFFVIGCNISNYSDAVVEAYEAGNEIGIHTYSHKSFTSMTITEIEKELAKTREILDDIDVDYSNIVRPPYGNINEDIQNNIDTSFILWNVDTRDWESRDKDMIIKEVKSGISNGSIILFHDIYPTTIQAIKEILPELTDEYEFVTVSELFNRNDLNLEENKKYYKVKK